eukprot:6535139-Lingulodinium_polyedra.AAC.1
MDITIQVSTSTTARVAMPLATSLAARLAQPLGPGCYPAIADAPTVPCPELDVAHASSPKLTIHNA